MTLKRYNLAVPTEVFDQLQAIADKKHTSVLMVIRQCIALGLLADELSKKPDSALVIRDGGREREIFLL